MKNPRQMRVANKVSYHRGEKSVDGCLTGVTTVAVETAVVMASAAMVTMTAAVGAVVVKKKSCHCRPRRCPRLLQPRGPSKRTRPVPSAYYASMG